MPKRPWVAMTLLLFSCASADLPERRGHGERGARGPRFHSKGPAARHDGEAQHEPRPVRSKVPRHHWQQPCESELQRLCRGGAEGAEGGSERSCLTSHLGELTLECRSALLGPPPPPAAGSPGARFRKIMEACAEEIEVRCADTTSRQEVVLCLSAQRDEVEAGCRAALVERPPAKGRSDDTRGKRGGKGRGKMGGMGGKGRGGLGGF